MLGLQPTTTALKAVAIDKYLLSDTNSDTTNSQNNTTATTTTSSSDGTDDYMMMNLGYGDAAPDSKGGGSSSSRSGYCGGYNCEDLLSRYEDALYGYEEHMPDHQQQQHQQEQQQRRNSTTHLPRRSSLRSTGSHRRASIGYSGEVEIVLPLGKPVKRKTSLSFADESQYEVKEVEPVAHMTEQPDRLWFQRKEYEHIKRKIYELLKPPHPPPPTKKDDNEEDDGNHNHTTGVEEGEEEEDDDEEDEEDDEKEMRGLEPVLNIDYIDYQRTEAKFSVLEEQTVQRAQGIYNDENMSKIYSFHTIDSSIQAQERAEQDAAAIVNYTKSTRQMLRRMSC